MSRGLLERIEKTGLFAEPELSELRELSERFPEPRAFATELVRLGKLTRWQAGQLVLGRNIILGKYILIDILSPDEVNPLFLAEHRAMERKVVLRVLAKSLSQAEEWRNRFLAEAQLWAALEHPRLVRTYNAEQDAGRYFLVLEFVDGESLQQLVNDSGPLPAEALLQLAFETAEALDALHSRGIVYGCLRPTKIMITPEGSVRLLDRGFSTWLADLLGSGSPEDRAERLTVWDAPELFGGGKPDVRSDLFSLGVCLLFAATGREPKRMTSEQEPSLWLSQELADVESLPPDLVDLLTRLLSVDPLRRPSQARAIMDELRPLVVVPAAAEESAAQIREPKESSELSPVAVERAEAAVLVGTEENREVGEESPAEAEVSAEDRSLAAAAAKGEIATAKAASGPWQWLVRNWQALPRARKIVFAALAVGALLLLAGGLVALSLWGRRGAPAQASVTKAAAPQEAARSRPQERPSTFREIEPDLNFDPTKFDQPAIGPGVLSVQGGSNPPSGQTSPAEEQVPEQKPDQAAEVMSSPQKEGEEAPPEGQAPPESVPPEGDAESSEKVQGEGPAEQPQPPAVQAAKPEAPFKELAEHVELPELPATKSSAEPTPFEVGRVGGPSEAKWQLLLLGGDRAFRKGWQFTIHELLVTEGEQSWMVQLEGGAGTKSQSTPVAKFWREGPRLYFGWEPQAPYPQANYLRNCLLQIRVDGASRILRLRETVRVDIPPLDLDRGTINVNIPAKWLPDDYLLWEVVGLDEYGQSVQSQTQLPGPARGVYDLTIVRRDRDGNTQPAVPIRVTFSSSARSFSLRLTLDTGPFRAFPRDIKQWTILRNSIDQQRREIEKKLNPPDKTKELGQKEKSELLLQLRELDKALWYLEFFEKVHKKARLHIRLFSEVAGEKLVFAEM